MNANIRIWSGSDEAVGFVEHIDTQGRITMPSKAMAAMLRVLADEIDPQPKKGPVHRHDGRGPG